jgi:filamin
LIGDDYVLEIAGPNQKIVPYTLAKKRAEFKTLETGNYVIRFIDRETRSVISSRALNVFNASMVKIVEVGEAYCHRPATIVVDVSEAGKGKLSALVKCGAMEVSHSIRASQTKNGIWELIYHPQRIASHKMTIMYNGIPISNKPIEINVLPPASGKEICVHGIGLYQSRIGKTTSFAIDTNGKPAREFDVVVSGPGGQALPVRCYQTKGGHLQAEFTVQKIGKCLIGKLYQRPVW